MAAWDSGELQKALEGLEPYKALAKGIGKDLKHEG